MSHFLNLNCKLLISTNELNASSIYSRSVHYVVEHTQDGSMGVMINKVSDLGFDGLMQKLGIRDTPEHIHQNTSVFIGGPIEPQRGVILYSNKHSHHAPPYLSFSKDMLIDIIHLKGPPNPLVALGFSIWKPFQLEEEISRNLWQVFPWDSHILNKLHYSQRYNYLADQLKMNSPFYAHQIGSA